MRFSYSVAGRGSAAFILWLAQRKPVYYICMPRIKLILRRTEHLIRYIDLPITGWYVSDGQRQRLPANARSETKSHVLLAHTLAVLLQPTERKQEKSGCISIFVQSLDYIAAHA
jgi:hypothetical protein